MDYFSILKKLCVTAPNAEIGKLGICSPLHSVTIFSTFPPFFPFIPSSLRLSTSIYLPSKSMCLIKPSAALKYWANMHSINACKCQPSIQDPSEYRRRCTASPRRGFVYACVQQIKAEGRTDEGFRKRETQDR